MMRDQLVIQERMDACLDSMAEEIRQLFSQSQEDGAKMTVTLLQLKELISSVEEKSRVVGMFQEIWLVAVMFFFELSTFLYVALNFLLCSLSYFISQSFNSHLLLIWDTQGKDNQEDGSF